MNGVKQPERNQTFPNRLVGYFALYAEYFRHLKRHGSLHLLGKSRIWYVFPYQRASELRFLPQEDSRRIQNFWRFMDGDKQYYPYFYMILVRAIRQALWMTRHIGDFELICVPRSDPDAQNPIAEVCAQVAGNEKFILAKAIDGSDVIKRKDKMTPIHRGGKYSTDEIYGSLKLARQLQSGAVILVDDMVFSGRTIAACKRLLRENGAKKIYAICLYGYKREDM